MAKSIKYKFTSFTWSLSSVDFRDNCFLNICNWNFTFEWFFFRSEGSFDVSSNLIHVNDCVTLGVLK